MKASNTLLPMRSPHTTAAATWPHRAGLYLGMSFALLALSMLLASGAFAQQVRRITFNEAVRIALDQNSQLKRVANMAELQAVSVSRQRMNFFPDLNLSTSGSQNYGRNFLPEEGRIVDQTTEYLNFGVSSGINLFRGFADVAGLRQAQLQLEARELDFDRARQTVVFNVMSNYLQLIERNEQIRVLTENLDAQRQQLAQIEEFVRVGARPISDLYQQQALEANAELNLLNAERLAQISEVNLIQVLELDPFGAYEFAAPEVDESAIGGVNYDLDNLLRQAFGRRPDLRATEIGIVAAEQGIRVARSSMWPNVSMRLNYGSNYTTADRVFGLWDQLDNRRGGGIGLSLSVPLFDRFSTRNSVQQARVQYDNARLDLDLLQHNVAVQVRQAYLDQVSAEKRLDVSDKQERSAALALEAAQERYNVGAATLVELSQARAAFVQAQSERVRARYDYLFQGRLIDYYLGALNPTEPLF
jgi:outer membrane protein